MAQQENWLKVREPRRRRYITTILKRRVTGIVFDVDLCQRIALGRTHHFPIDRLAIAQTRPSM